MATFTFADLIKPVTVDEAQTKVYQVLATLGVTTSAWKTGGVVRTMIRSLCIVYSAYSELQALAIAGGFLPLATGAWLTIKARYDYGLERLDPSFATGVVTFLNSSAYEYHELAGDVTVAASSTGKNYRTTGPLDLLANGSTQVYVQAVEAGSESTIGPGGIDTMVSTLLGVTCSNPDALVGNDEETDQQLRDRCAAFLGVLSPNGAPDAYRFVALSTMRPDGSTVGITRVKTTNDTYGNVYVYVADADGDVDPADLDLIETNIEAIYRVVPLGVYAHVLSAVGVDVTVTGDIWVHGTALSDADIQAAITSALTAFFAEQPIGGNIIAPATTGAIYLEAIKAAVMEAVPTAFHVTLTTPGADIALAANQVAVLNGAPTFTVHQEE